MKKLTREQLDLLAEYTVDFAHSQVWTGDLIVYIEKHYGHLTSEEVQDLEKLFGTDWEIPMHYTGDEKSRINFYVDRGKVEE